MLPTFVKLLNVIAIPLRKPRQKSYNFYLSVMVVFYTALTVTSLWHILHGSYFASNPMNAILHILVYIVINVLDVVAILQSGYCKSTRVDDLLQTLEDIRVFINERSRRRTEDKLVKLQRLDFVLFHATLVPWLVFMSWWVLHVTNFKMLLVYGLVYFNYYLTSMEVLKILMLLQLIKHLACETNRLLFRNLTQRNYLSDAVLKNYDKLMDCITLFNEAFGLQILGTVIVTPLVMVQAIFFNLSQIVFPSLMRTIVVNVATVFKFTLFLILSFMIATPSRRIAKEFQNARRICNTFRTNSRSCDRVERVLELVSSQLRNRRTSISAAGFFDADYTIIRNILVSTVSYVIVFLQINAKLPKSL